MPSIPVGLSPFCPHVRDHLLLWNDYATLIFVLPDSKMDFSSNNSQIVCTP